jgi:hypothetical protein
LEREWLEFGGKRKEEKMEFLSSFIISLFFHCPNTHTHTHIHIHTHTKPEPLEVAKEENQVFLCFEKI